MPYDLSINAHESTVQMIEPWIQRDREIDNHYRIQMVAETQQELVQYQAAALEVQQAAAIATLHGLESLRSGQDQTNRLLGVVIGGLDTANESLRSIERIAGDAVAATHALTRLLDEHFQRLAAEMLKQRLVLEQIAQDLRHPYEKQALELLSEGERALKQGMRLNGLDQQAEFADSMRLLQAVLDNPIGSRNYVAWFQTGWLRWKWKSDLAGAAEAFGNAVRLSAPKADLYHRDSLRHLAYVQYLQARLEDAYQTIQKATIGSPDCHGVLYDAARYAARTNREGEALGLLDRCIDLQPETIVTMLSEEDFLD